MSALLEFIKFKDFDLWDVKRYLSTMIYSNYDIVKLGDYIKEENTKIKPFEYPDEDFKILGVSNKIGLFDNEVKKGKDINQPYKIVKDGFLSYNPYRINVGSIGIKTDKQKNDLISPAYVVFSCNDKLLPEYLFMIFKTNIFSTIINESTRGSVRQILAFDILESLKIPLPSLTIQKRIVKDYQDKLNLSVLQEQQAKDKEKEIEEYLYRELGIEINESDENNNILNFINFKDINYWSIEKINQNIKIISKKYKLQNINHVCSVITDGTHQTPTYTNDGVIFLSAKNVTKEIIDWKNIKYVSQESHNNYCKRIQPSRGDILLAKNGTTGVGAIVDTDDVFSIYVSLALLRPIKTIINSNYLLTLINSSILRKQFFLKLVGVGVPNLHLREIREVYLPLPKLEIQNKIVKNIKVLTTELNNLKEQSIGNKDLALVEFEKEIFNEA